MLKTLAVLTFGIVLGAAGTFYGPRLASHVAQPYAGQNARAVSSLSASDIDQLLKGEGWGLAKPAEFNGFPGPAHVLELSDKLDLEADQRAKIEATFAAMRERAKELGVQFVAAEEALDAAFKTGAIDETVLRARIAEAEAIRARLRNVHLAAHLEITPLLTDDQKTRYAELRGYGAGGHANHSGH